MLNPIIDETQRVKHNQDGIIIEPNFKNNPET